KEQNSSENLPRWGNIMDLGRRGKVALVTGGSKGLGRAIAEELAKEGADLAICADASKASDTTVVIDGAMKELRRIDILVNNAGDAWLSHALNTTDEEWLYCLELNLMSAVRFTRGVVPHMRKQGGGRIINISTASAHTPLQTMHDYSSAKAGMLAFSKSVAFELAPDKILVNCVCPAVIHSPLW